MDTWALGYASVAFGLVGLRLWFQREVRRAGTKVARVQRRPVDLAILVSGVVGFPTGMVWLLAPGTVAWADMPVPHAVRWAGWGMGLAGLALFTWSHHSLGKQWSLRVALKEDHQLITTGPYRWVRHPMYTALLAWALSLLLVSANGLAGGPWVALSALAASRAGAEERLMEEAFGEGYRSWAARTGRFLPRVGAGG